MSKIKLLVEIDEEDYGDFCDWFESVPSSVDGLPCVKGKFNTALYDAKPYDNSGDLISREALKEQINATDFDFGDYYDNTEEIRKRVCEAIDNARTVFDCRSCKNNGNERECVDCHDYSNYIHYEEKQITDTWKSYCEGQEVGFKKAEDVFERMKLIQETVDHIRNTFKLDTESDKLVRNCMALVQNAIDGEYHDMEEVDVSEIERTQGKWIEREYRRYLPRDAEPSYNDDTYDEKTHSVIETHIVCSECGATKRFYHKFCGNCGADMRGGAK